MSYIQDVPDVMQISAFMSNSKCLKLARRFSDQVSKTMTEMMRRVDDFIESEEIYRSTELPRGEFPERGLGTSYRRSRPPRDIGNRTPAAAFTLPSDTLESGKLSHLVKDARQRGNARGRQQGNNNDKGKVINMVWAKGDNQKRKSRVGG
ncbi:hypothetical protein Tco_1339777 [Tanacetum coccineum]